MTRGLSCALAAVSLAVMVSGCRVRARTYTPSGGVRLVAVSPQVYAVADYDDPVFFYNDYYWRYSNGTWYRSSYLGGWASVSVSAVPAPIVRIDRPRRYRHYRAPRGARVRVIDRRGPRARGARVRARPGRRVRVQRRQDRRQRRVDRRQDRRERRIDRRQDRRERRIDRRQDRRERRGERREERRERRQDRRDTRRDRRRDRRDARGGDVRVRSGRGRARGADVRVRPR